MWGSQCAAGLRLLTNYFISALRSLPRLLLTGAYRKTCFIHKFEIHLGGQALTCDMSGLPPSHLGTQSIFDFRRPCLESLPSLLTACYQFCANSGAYTESICARVRASVEIDDSTAFAPVSVAT